MIRISISPAAYAAIAATLPGFVGVEPQRAPLKVGNHLLPRAITLEIGATAKNRRTLK